MSVFRLLILWVPADLLIDRDALKRLQLECADQFAARLVCQNLDHPAARTRIKLVGDWDLTPSEVWGLLADLALKAFGEDPAEWTEEEDADVRTN